MPQIVGHATNARNFDWLVEPDAQEPVLPSD
jgi:hypothetical protein